MKTKLSPVAKLLKATRDYSATLAEVKAAIASNNLSAEDLMTLELMRFDLSREQSKPPAKPKVENSSQVVG